MSNSEVEVAAGLFTVSMFSKACSAYEKGDFATALQELRSLAQSDHAHSQLLLASMYENGQGVSQDHIRAYLWYSFAAQNVVTEKWMKAMKAMKALNDDVSTDNDGSYRELAQTALRDLMAKMTADEIAEAQRKLKDLMAK